MVNSDLDQSRVTAVKAAQQVYGIGKVAAGVRTGSFEEGLQIGVTRAPVAGDTRQLGLGNADRLTVDGPINRHSYPLD